ncbi:MAG: hypothetical protein ACT4O9_01925 [Blastocatellia bacterium]
MAAILHSREFGFTKIIATQTANPKNGRKARKACIELGRVGHSCVSFDGARSKIVPKRKVKAIIAVGKENKIGRTYFILKLLGHWINDYNPLGRTFVSDLYQVFDEWLKSIQTIVRRVQDKQAN